MKHNKKRNTAFLYECLIKELTKSIVRNETDKKNQIIKIIKEYFHKGSALKQDLGVYCSILECKKMSNEFAQRFLFETKKDFRDLDRKEIFSKQTQLIKAINESISTSAFANFISNYKDIASVGAFFDSNIKAKSRLLIESRLINHLTKNKPLKKEMKHVDNLTYKTFINKFNKTYENVLRKEQKNLLMNYIISFSDNGLGLKSFLNEEISRLKKEVKALSENEKNSKNGALSSKLKRVYSKLESFAKTPITESLVKDIFYVQDLVKEVKK
tara:strand:+ start:151 stop:963 length:813 start_codon:yes stop_codon:yes gene_type:complete